MREETCSSRGAPYRSRRPAAGVWIGNARMNDGGSAGRWVSLVLRCASCGGGSEREGPPFVLAVPLARSSLDNGLELVVVPNHTAPIVTALIGVRAGAAVENASTNGYSHLFEHMIFQGSEAVPDPIAFRARLDELGVLNNGATGVDGVTYYFVAPAAPLEPALELFSRAVIAPALDPALLEKEKGVVLGEFDLNESDADFQRGRTGRAMLFGDYALHLDALGQRSVVTAATAAELRALHADYYVPSNALLVLSGDVTPESGRALAERYFGGWRGRSIAGAPS